MDGGELGGRAIVVATDPTQAADLLGLPRPRMRALTTYYHRLAASPASRPFLHVDGDRDWAGHQLRGGVGRGTQLRHGGRSGRFDGPRGADDAETLAAATRQLARMYGAPAEGWEHLATYAIPEALVAMPPGLDLRQPVDLGAGLFVCGDHRDTASIQGAIVSGRRTGAAVIRALA